MEIVLPRSPLCVVTDTGYEAVRYANVYCRHDNEVLTIGPEKGRTQLAREIVSRSSEPTWCLRYELEMDENHAEGYYISPLLSLAQILEFLDRFGTFFDEDGRHCLGIQSERSATLVLDDHGLIIVPPGPEGFQAEVLQYVQSLGFAHEEITLPFPHMHSYHNDLNRELEALMAWCEWQHQPN